MRMLAYECCQGSPCSAPALHVVVQGNVSVFCSCTPALSWAVLIGQLQSHRPQRERCHSMQASN